MAKTKKGAPPEADCWCKLPKAEQRALVLSCFLDFAEEGDDELARFLMHVGIDAEDLLAVDDDVEKAILNHYAMKDGYDVGQVAYDLARWPPIAERIKVLKRAALR